MRLVMKRVLKSLVIIGAAAGVFLVLGKLLLNSSRFHEYLRREVVQRLQSATGGSVSIESVRLGLFPAQLVISHLVVKSATQGAAPPVLSIPTTIVRFTFFN